MSPAEREVQRLVDPRLFARAAEEMQYFVWQRDPREEPTHHYSGNPGDKGRAVVDPRISVRVFPRIAEAAVAVASAAASALGQDPAGWSDSDTEQTLDSVLNGVTDADAGQRRDLYAAAVLRGVLEYTDDSVAPGSKGQTLRALRTRYIPSTKSTFADAVTVRRVFLFPLLGVDNLSGFDFHRRLGRDIAISVLNALLLAIYEQQTERIIAGAGVENVGDDPRQEPLATDERAELRGNNGEVLTLIRKGVQGLRSTGGILSVWGLPGSGRTRLVMDATAALNRVVIRCEQESVQVSDLVSALRAFGQHAEQGWGVQSLRRQLFFAAGQFDTPPTVIFDDVPDPALFVRSVIGDPNRAVTVIVSTSSLSAVTDLPVKEIHVDRSAGRGLIEEFGVRLSLPAEDWSSLTVRLGRNVGLLASATRHLQRTSLSHRTAELSRLTALASQRPTCAVELLAAAHDSARYLLRYWQGAAEIIRDDEGLLAELGVEFSPDAHENTHPGSAAQLVARETLRRLGLERFDVNQPRARAVGLEFEERLLSETLLGLPANDCSSDAQSSAP